jgi:hypothetical protein
MGTPDNDRRNLMQRVILSRPDLARSPSRLDQPSKEQIKREFEEAWRNTARLQTRRKA